MTESTESTELQPSESLPSASLFQPWWRRPEPILAIVGAILLRWKGLLGEEWTAVVLAAAVGSPITQAAVSLVKRVRGK